MQSSDANRYRTLADEARRYAEDMQDEHSKQMMLRIAREYEELTTRAEWLMSRKVDGRSDHPPHIRSDGQPDEDVARPSAATVRR
jgi:hypothetical protein